MNVAPLTASSSAAAGQIAGLAHSRELLSPAALRNAPPEVQRQQVAAQFEAILVRQLLAPTMTSMLGKSGGAASNVYGDMLSDTFAQKLTAGGGFGLSRLLEQQLAPRHPARSLAAAPSTAKPNP